MTKNEALKAAIDGAKVTCDELGFGAYVYYLNRNGFFYNQDGMVKNPNNLPVDSFWQILPKYVTFDEAIKAFEQGKTIQSEAKTCNGKNWEYTECLNARPSFYLEEIRGKWLILEDGK